MKRIIAIITLLVLCVAFSAATAERKTVVKDRYYLGAMRVVHCRDYVSLREAPDKTSSVLAKVPLGSIVLYCTSDVKQFAYSPYKKQIEKFIRCEYEGQEGYILKIYLEKAPEFEPVETRTDNQLMSRDEIIGGGEIAMEWNEYNVTVLAAREYVMEDDEPWETIRVGCFIDDDPIWGYTESVRRTGDGSSLSAFMGGTEDEPQVFVYDAEYGLTMLDLMEGEEAWSLSKTKCPLGDASVHAVGANTGILYVAGSDGPNPVAISSEGNVLWRSFIDDPEVYGPNEIILNPNDIEVRYESGKIVKLEYNGELISISDTASASN